MTKEMKQTANEYIISRAPELASDFGEMLKNTSPKEKELIIKLAEIKAKDTSNYTMEEIIEEGETLSELAIMNEELSKELNKFWPKFRSIVTDAISKFSEIGAKHAGKILISALLV